MLTEQDASTWDDNACTNQEYRWTMSAQNHMTAVNATERNKC